LTVSNVLADHRYAAFGAHLRISMAGRTMPGTGSMTLLGTLDGVTVVEFGHYVAGPFCTKLMAMQGARVIKIERPDGGDPARRLGPFPGDVPNPEASGLFLYLNGGKQSVCLNLKTATGRDLALALIAHADVVVENFRPEVMPRLGLGVDALRERYPDLVVTSISSFGATGPYAGYRAEEINTAGFGGLTSLLGNAASPPLKQAGNTGQYLAGTFALAGTLGALYGARAGRGGDHVTVAISDAVAAALPQALVEYVYTGHVGSRARANERLYPAQDGHVAIAYQQPQWPYLPAALGRPELRDDPRFATTTDRQQHQAELSAIVAEQVAGRDKNAVYHAFQRAHLPAGARMTAADLYASEQYRERGFFVTVDHPATGPLSYPGAPWQVEGRTWRYERAPLLGEHTAAVLTELCGVSPDDLPRLAGAGVI
jgi:crotonobetainyl-CoA:carnitine CoA-transferase CaiB-like acyl-CoA transferase